MTAPARSFETTKDTTDTATRRRAAGADALAHDAGLLALRLTAGLLMAGHGAQKLYGWWGGPDFAAVAGGFARSGYSPGRPFALLGSYAELAGGLLLALGFLTPLGCAAIIGVMFNAVVGVHWPSGVWVANGGYELPLLLGVAALAVAFTGPGQLSLDRGWRWAAGGAGPGLVAAGLGFAAGLFVLMMKAL